MPKTWIYYDAGTDFSFTQEDLGYDVIYINVTAGCTGTLPDAVEGINALIINVGGSTLTINQPSATLLYSLTSTGEVTLQASINAAGDDPEWRVFTTFTATNVSNDVSYDADATTLAEIADVLGTLILALRNKGIIN